MLSSINHVKRSNGLRPLPPAFKVFARFHGDASGSMVSMGDAPKEGAKNFVTQYRDFAKKHPNTTTLDFVTFSETTKHSYSGKADNLKDLDITRCMSDMNPTYSTKLYDTTIAAITQMKTTIDHAYDSLSSETKKLISKRDFSVVFALLTDGMDNRSFSNREDMRQTIMDFKKNYGAECIFLAANMSAENVGMDYGFDPTSCLQMGSDPHHAENAMKSMTSACLRSSSQNSSGLKFTKVERQVSCGVAESQLYSSTAPTIANSILAPPTLTRSQHPLRGF